jgi:hypothetical protein
VRTFRERCPFLILPAVVRNADTRYIARGIDQFSCDCGLQFAQHIFFSNRSLIPSFLAFQISRKAHTSGTMKQWLMTPRPWDDIATGYAATSPTPSNLWFCTWRRLTGESHKQTRWFASLYNLGTHSELFPSMLVAVCCRQRRKIDTESDPGYRRSLSWNFRAPIEWAILLAKSKWRRKEQAKWLYHFFHKSLRILFYFFLLANY